MANHTYQYQAFICCSNDDEKWGKWLQQALQRYKVPKALIGKVARDGIIGKNVGAVFLDNQEQADTTNIGAQQRAKLADSSYLLVICSPAAAKSQWINEQILEFKRLGKEAHILCFIVDGEPNAAEKPDIAHTECFARSIKYCIGADGNLTTTRTEPIAADARAGKDGKANATLKLLAGILGVNFNDLRQREVLRAKRRKQLLVLFFTCIMVIVLAVGWRGKYIAQQKALLQLQQQTAQAFTAAKTAMSEQRWDEAVAAWLGLADSEQFAYLSNAQQRELTMALHFALSQQEPVITELQDHISDVISMDISPDGSMFASADMEGNIMLYRTDTWQQIHSAKDSTPRLIWFSQDNKKLVSQPHPQHVYVIDTSTAQVKLYSTDRFSMHPLEISHDRKSWLNDETETVYAKAVSSGGQAATQRQFIALEQPDTLDVINLLDDSKISLPLLSDEAVSQVFIDAKQQRVNLFYRSAGLQQYSLANQQLLVSNPGCLHAYTKAPLIFNQKPLLVSRISEDLYTLCNLYDATLNQSIQSRKDDLVSLNEDETLIYFQDLSWKYSSPDVWYVAAQQMLPDAELPLPQQLAETAQRIIIQRTTYETQALDLAPLPYIATTNGAKVSIAALPEVPKTAGQLARYDRVQPAAHDWYVGEHRGVTDRGQLFKDNAQSGLFELDPQRFDRIMTTDRQQNYIVLVQKQLPRYEMKDGALFDVSIAPTLTLIDFTSGTAYLTQQMQAWALNTKRDTLVFIDENGAVFSVDLTASTLAADPIQDMQIDYRSYRRMFSGLDSDNLLLVNNDFAVQALSLGSKTLSPPIPLKPNSEDEQRALTIVDSTLPVAQQRYVLVDYGSRKTLVDIAQQQEQTLPIDVAADYLFDTPEPTLYFRLPGAMLLEFPLNSSIPAKEYNNVNIGYSRVDSKVLSKDMLLLNEDGNRILINKGVSALPLGQCQNSDVLDTAFEATSKLLATVSYNGLCIMDAMTLQPVLQLSAETLQLNSDFVAVFFANAHQLTLLLSDGNKVNLPISTELKTLIERAKQRHLSKKKPQGLVDNAA